MTLVDRAIDRGLAFLLGRQGKDGLWRDFVTPAGTSTHWVSGVVLCVLRTLGVAGEAVTLAIERLRSTQRAGGGWGYSAITPPDCDSTAWAMLALGEEIADRTAAIGYVMRHQDPEQGGFATYAEGDAIEAFIGAPAPGWRAPHSCVTGLAVQALARHQDGLAAARRGAAYLARTRRRDGGWRSYWWTGSSYATCHALRGIAAAQRHGPAPDPADMLLARQARTGGWAPCADAPSEPFETAYALLALAGRPAPAIVAAAGRAAAWMVAQQRGDGSWPSRPMMRLPPPEIARPDRLRQWQREVTGVASIISDRGRIFTTASALLALHGLRTARR